MKKKKVISRWGEERERKWREDVERQKKLREDVATRRIEGGKVDKDVKRRKECGEGNKH